MFLSLKCLYTHEYATSVLEQIVQPAIRIPLSKAHLALNLQSIPNDMSLEIAIVILDIVRSMIGIHFINCAWEPSAFVCIVGKHTGPDCQEWQQRANLMFFNALELFVILVDIHIKVTFPHAILVPAFIFTILAVITLPVLVLSGFKRSFDRGTRPGSVVQSHFHKVAFFNCKVRLDICQLLFFPQIRIVELDQNLVLGGFDNGRLGPTTRGRTIFRDGSPNDIA
mmetsp:Transcript_18426/g.45659  ORF Transcript_18426/g.45659 Transcript_18426/m.45659 type:complete len:225 (-) Transcript_18426:1540-2214(-)